MTTPVRLNDGRTEGYGLGWGLSTYRGRRVIHHAGGVPAFSSFFGRFEDDDLTLIVLSNLGGYNAAGLARPIANLVLSLPEPAHSPVRLDQEALRLVTGKYAGLVEMLEVSYGLQHLSVAGDVEGKLIPLSETVFTLADDADITIRFDDLDGDSFQWARRRAVLLVQRAAC